MDLGKDLGQGDKIAESRSVFRLVSMGSLSQLLNPVKHPQGHGSAAYRTDPVVFQGLGGSDADIALPVTVIMIFPLLGIQIQGADTGCRITLFQG